MEIWVLIAVLLDPNKDPVGNLRVVAITTTSSEAECQKARAEFATEMEISAAAGLLDKEHRPDFIFCRKTVFAARK